MGRPDSAATAAMAQLGMSLLNWLGMVDRMVHVYPSQISSWRDDASRSFIWERDCDHIDSIQNRTLCLFYVAIPRSLSQYSLRWRPVHQYKMAAFILFIPLGSRRRTDFVQRICQRPTHIHKLDYGLDPFCSAHQLAGLDLHNNQFVYSLGIFDHIVARLGFQKPLSLLVTKSLDVFCPPRDSSF